MDANFPPEPRRKNSILLLFSALGLKLKIFTNRGSISDMPVVPLCTGSTCVWQSCRRVGLFSYVLKLSPPYVVMHRAHLCQRSLGNHISPGASQLPEHPRVHSPELWEIWAIAVAIASHELASITLITRTRTSMERVGSIALHAATQYIFTTMTLLRPVRSTCIRTSISGFSKDPCRIFPRFP